MSHTFRGHLCGRLCEDCIEYLGNVTLKLYRLRDDQPPAQLAVANPKYTLRRLTGDEIKGKKKSLLASGKTDANGNFNVDMPDDYDGGPFEIDVCVDQMPGQKEPMAKRIQASLTVLQPEWRRRDDRLIAIWHYCIPQRFWCWLRERLGLYVICGRVVDCRDKGDVPIPGVRVHAFDRDWLQDDALGGAVTNLSGEFRIYYTEDDFKPGTFIDVELFGGPDLYFRVETPLGAPILIEDPSRGRDPDRENVGACFCVKLCADEPPPVVEPLPFFSHLGVYEYDTDVASGPGDAGLTIGDHRAFYANVRLNGVVSKTLNGSPMEYRFEYRERDAGGAWQGPWQQASAGQIAKTKIGVLQRANPNYPATSPNPIESVDYVIGPAAPDELTATIASDVQGDWVQVPQESNSPLSAAGFFIPNGNMIRLETKTLASFSDIDLTGLLTGSSSTSTGKPEVQNRYFAIRMRVREVGTSSAGMQAGICEKVAINNVRYDNIDSHPDWSSAPKSNQLGVAMVNITQLTGPGSGCNEISNTTGLDVTFTAAHPTLGSVSIWLTGPGGPYSFILPAAATPGDHFGTATPNFTLGDLTPCAYIVTLSVQVLLTTGDSVPDNLFDQIAFCKS